MMSRSTQTCLLQRLAVLLISGATVIALTASCGQKEEEEKDKKSEGGSGDNPGGTGGGSSDDKAPAPGDDGALDIESVGATTATVSWTAATDEETDSEELEYAVYTSMSENLDNFDDLDTYGEEAIAWTADITTADLSNLNAGSTVYVNVIVRDAKGNRALYEQEPMELEDAPFIDLNLNYPTLTRSIVLTDDIVARTIGIETNATALQCSTDNGATWSTCTSNTSFVIPSNAMTATYKVRATLEGAINSPREVSFTPNTSYLAGKTLLNCTANVTSNEDFDTFEARLTGSAVVCLGNGVSINNDNTIADGSIATSANNVTIATRHGHTATISNQRTNAAVKTIEFTGQSNRLVGVTVSSTSDATVVELGGSFGLLDHSLVDSNSTSTGITALVFGSGSNNRAFASGVETSGFSAMSLGAGSGILLQGLTLTTTSAGDGLSFVSGSLFSATSLNVTAAERAVVGTGTSSQFSATFNQSTLISTDTGSNARTIFITTSHANDVFNLVSSTVKVGGSGGAAAAALVIDGTEGLITLSGTTFRRANTGGGANGPAIRMTGNSGSNAAMLAGNLSPSTFCRESAAGKTFSAVLDTSVAQSNFSTASQANGGSIVTCAP